MFGKCVTFLVIQVFISVSSKTFPKLQFRCANFYKKVEFDFNNACKYAFDRLKDLFTSTLIIHPLNWDLPFKIMCDASNTTVGTVLRQKVDQAHHIIYYASKTLDSAQSNYITIEK